jgi:hypothetical protein
MTNLRLTLLAAASIGAVSVGGASAMPFDNSLAALNGSNAQQVRIVCDQFGRCYDTRRNYRSTRYYAPDRGYAYGAYGQRYSSPGVRVGVGPYGVWVR